MQSYFVITLLFFLVKLITRINAINYAQLYELGFYRLIFLPFAYILKRAALKVNLFLLALFAV